MNIFLALITVVFLVDIIFFAIFFDRYAVLGLLLLPILAGFLYMRQHVLKPKAIRRSFVGWRLPNAIDVSIPDRPKPAPDALIQDCFFDQGILVIGARGSGKTKSANLGILKTLDDIWPQSGFAQFDGKGDLDFYKDIVGAGIRLDRFFSSEMPYSCSTNLLEGDVHDNIDLLANILVGKSNNTDYYSDAQISVLQKVMPILFASGEPVNLRDLYAMLTNDDAAINVMRLAQASNVDESILNFAREYFEIPLFNRVMEIKGMLNKLFTFCSGPMADRLNAYQPDLSIAQAVANNERVFFHLPLSEFSKRVAEAFTEKFEVEASRRQKKLASSEHPFSLSFDDWGEFIYEGFEPFAARCRSANMPLMFSFQSRAQLDAVNPTFADTMDDHMTTKIVMRVNGDYTSRYAAQLMGRYDSVNASISEHSSEGVSMGVQSTDRFSTHDFRDLAKGEAFTSTVIEDEFGRTRNKLYRFRFPLIDTNVANAAMPEPHPINEGYGLGLWSHCKGEQPHHNVILESEAV